MATFLHQPILAVLAIALASFFNDTTMPGSWTTCMDIGGKYTGTVSGAMNMMGNFGGVVSPVVLGYVVKETGNWNLTFYLTAGLYFVGATLLALHQLDQAAAAGLRRIECRSRRAAAPGRRPSIFGASLESGHHS